MNRIKTALAIVLAALAGTWLLADTLLPQPLTYFSFRSVFVQFSGVLAIGAMSVAMVLALRLPWIERHLDGLDKVYRLHKWLGITALAMSVLHWWWAQGTKWMVGWGWLERPVRPPRGAQPDLAPLDAWLRAQRGLAETLGEWAFYAAAVLVVLALVRRIPYHWFRKVHVLFAPLYLVLAFHTVVLATPAYWKQPVGWLLAVLLAAGSTAALLSIFRRIGARRKVQGRVEAVQLYPALDVLEMRIALQPGWPGHAAGQFAFLTTDPREGAHPFTIASAWDAQTRRITFIAKALGDHTRRLCQGLQPGAPVVVEGPYGRFDFEDGSERQIWVGAGIGITPFIARMKQLAAQPQPRPREIDLFHPTAVFEPAAIDKLTAVARAAGARLHVLVDGRDGRLDGPRLRTAAPEWRKASVWFCGPASFGSSLRADLLAQGLPPARFHQELFQMR